MRERLDLEGSGEEKDTKFHLKTNNGDGWRKANQ